jgi:hypothetical protein
MNDVLFTFFILFAHTINYMRNYNYRQNHLVLVLTLEVLWYYSSKINMATPLAECTLCPTKIKQSAILYAPLQLQSQFKSVTFPIFVIVNTWSLSFIHYNQSRCVHINQRRQYTYIYMQETWPVLPPRNSNELGTLVSDTWDEVASLQQYVWSLTECMLQHEISDGRQGFWISY